VAVAGGLGAAPLVIYDLVVFRSNPAMAAWSAQNVTLSLPPWDYALGYGLILVLAVAGLPVAIRRRRPADLLVLAWVASAAVLLYAPISVQRRFITGLHVPLVLLAALGVERWLWPRVQARGRRRITMWLVGVTSLTSLVVTSVTIAAAARGDPPLVMSAGEAGACAWLRANTAWTSTVLAPAESGQFFPAWAGNRVVYGHPFETIDATQKRAEVDRFYTAGASSAERAALLERYGVHYVFVDAAEPSVLTPAGASELGLAEVWSGSGARLYRVGALPGGVSLCLHWGSARLQPAAEGLMIRRRDVLPVAILGVLPLVLYAPFLFGGRVLYWGVYLQQFYPWRALAVEQMRSGHWPLWNPTLGAGTPLAANLQTAAFYPPNVLFLLMPVERAFGWELALHVALAGLGAYALGRGLGLGRFGALMAGLAYGLGGYLTAHWVFPSMVYAAAWLPLILALADRLLRRARSGLRAAAASTALLGLAIALQLLAGHAQTSFYSLIILAAFVLYRLGQANTTGLRRLMPLGWAILAGLWAAALAAVQLLPTAELMAHSQRSGPLSDLRFAFELSFWPWRLISLAAPDFYGNPLRDEYWGYGSYWEEAAFAGILALVLAALAVAWWWRARRRAPEEGLPDDYPARRSVPFWALLALISLLLALGNHTPLYPLLFRYVPGFGLFQAPARMMIGYALGVAVLAGIGAEWAAGPGLGSARQGRRSLLLVAGLGIAAAGLVVRLAMPGSPAPFGPSLLRLGGTLALAAGLLVARFRVRAGVWQALAVLLLAADLLVFGWGTVPGTDPAVYRERPATAALLAAQPPGRLAVAYPYAQEVYDRYVSRRSFGSRDPADLRGLLDSLIPNLSASYGLSSLGNYDPLLVGPYADLWQRASGSSDVPVDPMQAQRVWDLAAVRYVIDDDSTSPALSLLSASPAPGPRVYRNDSALPEALVVPQARVIENAAARLSELFDPSFNPRQTVLLSRAPPAGTLADAESGSTAEEPRADVVRDGPNRVTVHTTAPYPGILVLNDTNYPGWQAAVDGRPVEILTANHAFRGVAVPAGQHTATFSYEPLSFRVGAWISMAAVLALLAVLAAARAVNRARSA
jgi:hypothetical protein